MATPHYASAVCNLLKYHEEAIDQHKLFLTLEHLLMHFKIIWIFKLF